MKKRGFTLVEIIAVIGILAVIGTASFFGIRLVSNTIKENKLESIEDKIMLAAEVYIETNKEVKNKVNDEGVIIPLNVLHNEGLINLDGVIDKNDDDYVVALLGSDSAGEECEATYIEGSWKIGSKTIYICTKSSGSSGGSGGSNFAIIDPNSMSNLNKVERGKYFFTGTYVDNYAYIEKDNKRLNLRIYKIDADDSLIVYQAVTNLSREDYVACPDEQLWKNYFGDKDSFFTISPQNISSSNYYDRHYPSGATAEDWFLKAANVYRRKSCGGLTGIPDVELASHDMEWLHNMVGGVRTSPIIALNSVLTYERLHLKPCVKIVSGTGSSYNPYELKSSCKE